MDSKINLVPSGALGAGVGTAEKWRPVCHSEGLSLHQLPDQAKPFDVLHLVIAKISSIPIFDRLSNVLGFVEFWRRIRGGRGGVCDETVASASYTVMDGAAVMEQGLMVINMTGLIASSLSKTGRLIHRWNTRPHYQSIGPTFRDDQLDIKPLQSRVPPSVWEGGRGKSWMGASTLSGVGVVNGINCNCNERAGCRL